MLKRDDRAFDAILIGRLIHGVTLLHFYAFTTMVLVRRQARSRTFETISAFNQSAADE